ncbi:MAG TPA: 16S rRNA (uracil(1498)-N(3))-methyltransferase, partial [Methylophilaceae bacterium]|nr:16S rRNA (uracil(1498)-N(3))-methyltransferase [Methylophilaceae bacterium]
LAINHAFIPINFGQRILRTETAPIVALSILQNLWGDFA